MIPFLLVKVTSINKWYFDKDTVKHPLDKAHLREKAKMSTSWGGLKRFRVKGAFLKSPLSGPGQTALVAPAGAKYPSRLKAKVNLA